MCISFLPYRKARQERLDLTPLIHHPDLLSPLADTRNDEEEVRGGDDGADAERQREDETAAAALVESDATVDTYLCNMDIIDIIAMADAP